MLWLWRESLAANALHRLCLPRNMLVFIFVFPTQQDLWRHNNPSEPQERRGRQSPHKCMYFSEPVQRAWILREVYVCLRSAWRQSWVCTKKTEQLKHPWCLSAFLCLLSHLWALAPSTPLHKPSIWLPTCLLRDARTHRHAVIFPS